MTAPDEPVSPTAAGGAVDIPGPPARRRWPWIAGLCAVVLVAVLGGISLSDEIRCGSVDPISGLRDVGGECVGVTDGSYVFEPEFASIQKAIKAENDWVAEQAEKEGKPAVKVAMLSTLSVSERGPLAKNEILHGLQGSYVAQRRANRTRALGDKQPLIQLYLANEGSIQQGWETAVNQLKRMTGDDIPLAIVMGQSISTEETTEAAKALSEADIPIVTGTTTADGLDFAGVPGLLRAAPSNSDFAKAIRRYLDGQKKLKKGVLVFDSQAKDTFSATLKAAIERDLGPYIGFSKQPFPGVSVDQGGPEVFGPITQNICLAVNEGADMVFFSGRAPDMASFAEALSERTCRAKPLVVFYVDLGLYPRDEEKLLENLRKGNVTMLHATGYDPRWLNGQGDKAKVPEGFTAFKDSFAEYVGGPMDEAFKDGYGPTDHDAMATAIRAVRITNPGRAEPPSAADVREHLLLLNGVNAVRGATGTLQYNENRHGNPGGKHVPIVPLPLPSTPNPTPTTPYITPVE